MLRTEEHPAPHKLTFACCNDWRVKFAGTFEIRISSNTLLKPNEPNPSFGVVKDEMFDSRVSFLLKCRFVCC